MLTLCRTEKPGICRWWPSHSQLNIQIDMSCLYSLVGWELPAFLCAGPGSTGLWRLAFSQASLLRFVNTVCTFVAATWTWRNMDVTGCGSSVGHFEVNCHWWIRLLPGLTEQASTCSKPASRSGSNQIKTSTDEWSSLRVRTLHNHHFSWIEVQNYNAKILQLVAIPNVLGRSIRYSDYHSVT
jgi:hypothetical protein